MNTSLKKNDSGTKIIKRFTGNKPFGHGFKLLNLLIAKKTIPIPNAVVEKTCTALIPYVSKNKDLLILSKNAMSKKDEIPDLKAYYKWCEDQSRLRNNLINSFKERNGRQDSPDKISSMSGLLDIPPEYDSWKQLQQTEFCKFIITVKLKVLFILGNCNITSDVALFENIGKFFQSINPIINSLKSHRKLIPRYMGILQHTLVSIFLDKPFALELFKKYFHSTIDYNLHKKGNILLLIEAYTLCQALQGTLNEISFVSINPQVPCLELTPFKKETSLLKTGQPNCDWYGIQAVWDEDKQITLREFYKEVKMFESGINKGRLSLKPELNYDEQAIREYVTKYTTSFQQYLKNNNIEDKNHPLHEALAELDQLQIKIFTMFRNPENLLNLKNNILKFNEVIRTLMLDPNISEHINLGISVDPGIDQEFSLIFHEHIEQIMTKTIFNKKDISILLKSSFSKKEHREQLRLLIEKYLPKELQTAIQKSIEYIDK